MQICLTVRQTDVFRLQQNERAINLRWPRLMIVRYVACLFLPPIETDLQKEFYWRRPDENVAHL
jgi:hypothetical protein